MRCIGIVLFCSVILTAAISSQEDDNNEKENELLATRRQKRSMIFFPAEKNSMHHKRYPSPKGHRRRFRRNAFEKEREAKKSGIKKNFLDYDGWQPLNRFDPMSEEPTLIYKPPSLERVHFGKDPPKERPLYPVLPVNPPVYVIRAEPAEKEIHAIYGTENINYLHVNPKTQQAKAYSAFGKNRFYERNPPQYERTPPQYERTPPQTNLPPKSEKSNSSSFSLSDILKSFVHINIENLNSTLNSSSSELEEDDTESDKNEKVIEATNETTIMVNKIIKSDYNNNNPNLNNTIKIESNNTINLNNSSNQSPNTEKTGKEKEATNSQFSVKSLAVDDDDDEYYYIYEDEEIDENPHYESQIETNLAKPEYYDPFASIIPKISNDYSYEETISNNSEVNEVTEDEIDPYFAEASETVEQRASARAPLHQLLRNFDGVQFDQYIFSASENKEKSLNDNDPGTVSRSRLTIPFKPQIATGRKINSPTVGVNSRDWYLIDTRSKQKKDIDPRWKNSFDERDYFIDRSTSKYSESQNLYKSLNENKINAFNTHESLTANSLSELLQIFKYVTTPNPIQRFSDYNAFQSRYRTFRYTKPTEPPNRTKHFTTFRYTVPVSRLVDTTESTPDFDVVNSVNNPTPYVNIVQGVNNPTPDVDVHGINDPSKVINDTVAETNSLDGYLFSDSVNAPKYRRPDRPDRPDVRPNSVKTSEKRATIRKPSKAIKKDVKMDKDAVQRGDIAPPLIIEIKESANRPFYESYLIHQGHSKVKVYGLNSDPKSEYEFTTQRSKSTTLDHILMTPSSFSSPSTVVTTAPTTTVSITPKVIIKRQIKTAKSLASSEFLERIDTDKQVTVSKNIPRWTRHTLENRLKGKENDENYVPSPFKIFSDLFTKFLQ